MRRLSILDLTGGRQPMSNEDGSLWIVHNGEIFNSPELRQDLERRGHRFASRNSDTEVLLHLYEEKGADMLTELNGMFALVIYDRRRELLFGARDRIGIKPIYYTQGPHRFAFASELKCLLPLPWVTREVDRASLFHYMSLGFVPGKASILRNIHRLLPGHSFEYDLRTGKFQSRPYWSLRFRGDEQRDVPEWAASIRHELREAVRRWTLSDVPVGVSLSGGLDSSAIVGLLAEAGYGPIRTYSLGFAGRGEEEWNELPLARRVAERWGTEHHEVVLDPDDLLRDLLRMVWHLDEPYGGGLPSWYVFGFMREHVTVGLTGTGGDELFGDYGRFHPYEDRIHRGSPSSHIRGGVGDWDEQPTWESVAWRPFASLLNQIPEGWLGPRRKRELVHFPDLRREPFRWYYFNRYYYIPDELKRESLFSLDMSHIPDTSRVLQRYGEASGTPVPRDALMHLAFGTQLPEEFLLMTDRFSMAHSLEARVPFLDHLFVELMCRVPAELRTRRGDLKYLLKRAVGDLLPPEVLQARKRGFILPTARWLRTRLRPLAERLLSVERLKKQDIFRPDFYRDYVVPHLEGRVDNHAQIWIALMFQLWYLLYVEERLMEAPPFSWGDVG